MKYPWSFGLLVLAQSAFAQVAWEQVLHGENMTIYTRLEPGKSYKSFKAVAVIPTAPEVLQRVLNDPVKYDQWLAYTKSSRLLATNRDTQYVYMETQFPWPFKNEDMIYAISSTTHENGAIQIQLSGLPTFIPEVEGVNRMRSAEGYIFLEPQNGHTCVTYTMQTELSGKIPPWMANQNIYLMPLESMKRLIEMTRNNTLGGEAKMEADPACLTAQGR